MLYTDTLSHRASYALYIRGLVAVDDVYSTCYVAPTDEGASIVCKIRFTVLLFLSNKPVFSFLRTLTTWHYPHSHAARRAAVRRAAIDRCRLSAGPPAANLQQLVCCCGQTDGPTPHRCIDPALMGSAKTANQKTDESGARFTKYLTYSSLFTRR